MLTKPLTTIEIEIPISKQQVTGLKYSKYVFKNDIH